MKNINDRVCFMPDYDGGVGTGDSGGFNDTSNSGDGGSDYSGRDYSVPNTPVVEETIDLGVDQTPVDPNSKGTVQSDGTTTYGLDTLNGVITEESYLDGLITVDTHYTLNGQKFSAADELAADALELLNIDITELNIDIAEDLVGVVVAAATSGLSLALGIKSLGLAADIAYSNKTITKQQYNTAKAVVAVASFMKGTISNMQAASAISTAKSYGAITGMEAAIMGGLIAYSEYNSFTSLQTNLNKLGYTSGRPNDLENLALFGVTSGGDGENYYQGEVITDSNIESIITAYVYFMNTEPEIVDDVFLRMAGGVMVDNYLAGGDLWNPVHSVALVNNGMIGISAGISNLGTWLTEGNTYLEQVAQSSVRNYR